MADTRRSTSARLDLFDALENKPFSFDFFQALRKIESAFPDSPKIGHAAHANEEDLRFAQEPSLAFAPSALASFTPTKENSRAKLSVLFFGLFGPNGPLPQHLTEYARERLRSAHDPTFAHFADLFHHRMLSLFYRAWASAQPTTNFDRPNEDRFSIFVSSLFGLGLPELRNRSALPDLFQQHFAGRLNSPCRNPEGLEAMLASFFNTPVTLEEFIGQWITLPEEDLCQLGDWGQSNILGQTATLGTQIWTCQQKFRIVMGPMDLEAFQKLQPGTKSLNRLTALVRSYVGDELEWDLRLILKKEKVPAIQLGKTGHLGWTSWISPECLENDAEDLLLAPLGL